MWPKMQTKGHTPQRPQLRKFQNLEMKPRTATIRVGKRKKNTRRRWCATSAAARLTEVAVQWPQARGKGRPRNTASVTDCAWLLVSCCSSLVGSCYTKGRGMMHLWCKWGVPFWQRCKSSIHEKNSGAHSNTFSEIFLYKREQFQELAAFGSFLCWFDA